MYVLSIVVFGYDGVWIVQSIFNTHIICASAPVDVRRRFLEKGRREYLNQREMFFSIYTSHSFTMKTITSKDVNPHERIPEKKTEKISIKFLLKSHNCLSAHFQIHQNPNATNSNTAVWEHDEQCCRQSEEVSTLLLTESYQFFPPQLCQNSLQKKKNTA